MCPEEAALLGICNDPGSTHLRGLCLHTLQPQGSPPHSRDQRDPGERPPRPRGSAPPWGHPTHLATARSTWGSCSHFFRASTLLVFLWGLASRKTASDHRTPAIQTEMLALRLLLPLALRDPSIHRLLNRPARILAQCVPRPAYGTATGHMCSPTLLPSACSHSCPDGTD